MKKILVTGGAGFIGSHTVDLLIKKNFEVIVYDNFSSGKIENLPSNIEVVKADILDYSTLAKTISSVDAIVHLAALASVPKSIEDPLSSFHVNSLGFVNVLQAICESKKNVRVVYASSAAVYGDAKNLPCSDENNLVENVLSPYALEKVGNEQWATLFLQLYGIKSIGMRYFNVYGPRQDPNSPYSGVISKFIENYKARKKIKIFGDGKQSRDFIHVHDVARANVLALINEYCGELNVATGVPETLLNLVKYLESAGGGNAEIEFANARVGDIKESYASVEKAKQHLNFSSEISLKDGIKEMLE